MARNLLLPNWKHLSKYIPANMSYEEYTMGSTRNVLSFVMTALLFLSGVVNVSADEKKWHPGHYMLVWQNSGIKKINKILNEPNFKGAIFWHSWRELESSKGVYNFSVITNELRASEAHDKRFALQLLDKTFGSKYAPCVPDYMLKEPVYQGGQSLRKNGYGEVIDCVPKRWIPAVQDRLIALYTALGKRFDAEPYFEAIQNTENVISPRPDMRGYSVAAHTEQLKRGLTALVKAFPHTQVFQKVNWQRSEVAALVAHARTIGAGIGGPDIMPTHQTDAYPHYRANYGKMPLAMDGQPGGVAKYLRSGEVDFDDIFRFVATHPDGLRTNYVFWAPSENTFWSFERKVKPVVNKYKGYINKACPLSITCQ